VTARGHLDHKLRKGYWEKALRAVEGALRQDPTDRAAWQLREELMLLEEREARRHCEPKSAQAQLEVGFSYLALGCDGEAMEALREAVRLDPDLFVAHVVLGIAYHHQKQTDDARRCYEQAIRLQPANEVCHDLLRSLLCGELPPMPVEDRPDVRARADQAGIPGRLFTAG
jgi:tetratricopeptide (TPR) repeat protein